MADPDARRRLAESLAPDVRAKPAREDFAPPVAWLLGPDLIGALKQFLVYSLYKGELDPHDWMDTAPIDHATPPDDGALWFDYVADIGDGQRAMYTTALVCQDDVWIEGTLDEALASRHARAHLPAVSGTRADGWSTLPRGRLLVVGGDTAYPLADTINLENHVRLPFTWAYRDLVAAGRLVDDDGTPHAPVDLFGIPGNHDYYDLLVGFNRIFRKPVGEEGTAAARERRPSLALLGYRRRQTASYFAIDLPWGWKLWGLDPGMRGVDVRQRSFFAERGVADRLIACWPTPPIAFGRVVADRIALRDLAALGLAAPFLDDTPLIDGTSPPPPAELPRALGPTQCRLDLSGDMHYYARFGDSRYGCVVSGGGAAFHQPSQTDFHEVTTHARYPEPATSRRAIADALFHPFTIVNGGVVNVAIFLVAVVLCSGSLWGGTRGVTDWMFAAIGLGDETVVGMPGKSPLPPAEWSYLAGAAIFVASILAAAALVFGAIRYARWVNRMLRTPRALWTWTMRALRVLPIDRLLDERGYLPSWLLALAGLSLPVLTAQLVDEPGGAVLLFQALFLLVVVGLAVALIPFAVGSGGEYLRRRERWVMWLLGVGHLGIQLAMPVAVARIGFGAPLGLGLAIAVEAATVALGWQLARRGGRAARWPALLLWVAHGPLVLLILVVFADGAVVRPVGGLDATIFVVCAGILGAVLGCLEYGWYLAVALGWNGHNNEAGAAARLERFRQFIRFRVERDRLTGFVIAVDAPGTAPDEVRPRVVDVFTIEPP